MNGVMLEARGVTRVLPGPPPATLVGGIDLIAQPGEFLAITGPSGSGKSSLLYLLGLLDIPSGGDVLLGGLSTAARNQEERARLRLEHFGFVFQFHFLLPELSALDNVLIPMRKLNQGTPAQQTKRASTLLESLGMADHRHKLPAQMSGGERQRTAIARALANEPQFILADEPTGALTATTARRYLISLSVSPAKVALS